MNIGCHVSIAGGIWNAPKNGHILGCEAIQIFTRPPQGGPTPKITNEIIKKFKTEISKFGTREVYIHTPYYINLASANNRIGYGSMKVIRDELERGSLIGAKYVMTHLGTAKDLGQKEAIGKIVEMLKKSLDGYAGSTELLLENSAGAGKIIGDNLEELKEIIESVKSSIIAGICLDTQHSFASGYNWRDFGKTLKEVNKHIGIKNIKLIHANDSQADYGSKKDRHAHIGQGKIGLDFFKNVVFFARENNIDMICETEYPGVEKDIQLLKNLRNN